MLFDMFLMLRCRRRNVGTLFDTLLLFQRRFSSLNRWLPQLLFLRRR